MRKEIVKYAFYWNHKAGEGHIQLLLSDDSAGQFLIDSPAEGMLLLDILRNEKPVYWNDVHELIMTGLEPAGRGESDD